MMQLKIDSDWFELYEVSKNMVIGIDFKLFYKIISCVDTNYTIELNFEDNILNIVLSNGEIIKEYRIVTLNLDTDIFDVPEMEYTVDITMSSQLFKKYIAELGMFGDYLKITCDEKGVMFLTECETMSSKITIYKEYLEEYCIDEKTHIEQEYNLKIIKMASNFAKLNNSVVLNISNDTPIKITYILDGINYLSFFFAPNLIEPDT